MDKRKDDFFGTVIIRGIELSLRKDVETARTVMQRANLPEEVIERVIHEPSKIRSTDLMEKSKSTNAEIESSPLICSDLPLAFLLEQQRMVQIKAYSNAEKDNFRCSPDYYWLSAEIEICKEMM